MPYTCRSPRRVGSCWTRSGLKRPTSTSSRRISPRGSWRRCFREKWTYRTHRKLKPTVVTKLSLPPLPQQRSTTPTLTSRQRSRAHRLVNRRRQSHRYQHSRRTWKPMKTALRFATVWITSLSEPAIPMPIWKRQSHRGDVARQNERINSGQPNSFKSTPMAEI